MRFIKDGKLILGICNGFQVLVRAGFLPEPSQYLPQLLTFSTNDSGKFECRWVHLGVNKEYSCVFTEGIDSRYLPVAHAEGKVVTDPEVLPQLRVALYYTDEHGRLYKLEGDNNNRPDPYLVRDIHIKYLIVGVVYITSSVN